jgi:hypothetical protein
MSIEGRSPGSSAAQLRHATTEKAFLQFVEQNPNLKMLVDDFEHIVNLRKNAALVATGRIWNALWHFGGFRLGK